MISETKKRFSQAQRDKLEFGKARAIRGAREAEQKLVEARQKRDKAIQKLKEYDKTHR